MLFRSVVVATPLRLIDLLKDEDLQLDQVQIVVLDEADRMADDGFTPQVEWILRKVTGAHQTMLFSATLDGDVGHLVARYMTDPTEVAIDAATDTVTRVVGNPYSPLSADPHVAMGVPVRKALTSLTRFEEQGLAGQIGRAHV